MFAPNPANLKDTETFSSHSMDKKKIARHERRAILSAAPCHNQENIKLIFTSKKHITKKKRTQRSL